MPNNFQQACLSLDRNDSIVLTINKTDDNRFGITNLSRKEVSETVLGESKPPFKEGEMRIALFLEGVRCLLKTRPLNRLEELAFEYMELLRSGTTRPFKPGSSTIK